MAAIQKIERVVPTAFLHTIISAITAILIPPALIYFKYFKYFDLGYRVCLAEFNRYWNRQRYAEQKDKQAPPTMACVVGYREEPEVYKQGLLSLKHCKTGCVVAAIDGDDDEDLKMVDKFMEVFTDGAVLHLDSSIGKRFIRPLDQATANSASANGHANGHAKGSTSAESSEAHTEAEALAQAYKYAREKLVMAGVLNQPKAPQAICFTQPHCDLKEIRFSAWVVSLVIADTFSYEYLWSSDSDTRVEPDTLDTLARVIRAEPRAAGGGVYVRLHNAGASAFARMASLAWALDTYMNRAALGAFGTSECLNGPSSMYRISALRDVAVAQYRFHYFKQKEESYTNTVLNEDIQTTMMLAKKGWQRLYIENASIETGGPETLRQWLGQRLRWSRGINLHRVFDAWYISSQGPLTTWYWLRSGFYDVFVFLFVSWYTFTGRQLFRITIADVVVFELIPPLYNFFRCSTPLPDPFTTVVMFAIYRLVCPSYRMYTFLTPFGLGWSLPKKQQGGKWDPIAFVKREHETLFFCFWVVIAAGAVARLVPSFTIIALNPDMLVPGCMLATFSATATAMFA